MGSSNQEELATKMLFKSAMKNDWSQVVEIYMKYPAITKSKITRAGDTALHLAVLDGQEEVVENLVQLIAEKDALEVQNEQGNTPLHLAAEFGSVKMCRCITTRNHELIRVRNNEKETPFFVAVLNGNKDAFLFLHNLCASKEIDGYDYCRRSNGDNILHCAINGEYFYLAFQIILRYDKLVNYVNNDGYSPLHVLASKPSFFSSGKRLGWFGKIIYACTSVNELKRQEKIDEKPPHQLRRRRSKEENKANYPKNNETCVNLFCLFVHVFRAFFRLKNKSEPDAESNSQSEQAEEHQMFPTTYNVFIDTIKFVLKALVIVLGFGSRYIRNIQEKKKKHTWSVQIMNELLRHSQAYEYDANGQEPRDHGPSWPWSTSDAQSLLGKLPDEAEWQTKTEHRKSKTREQRMRKTKTDEKKKKKDPKETPILLAAKNGITEMVEKILDHFPVAIYDMNSEKKNAVLLAVEYRQPHVYQKLDERDILKDSIFRKVDQEGNSALHLAAKLEENPPWLIPGAALQMKWEIEWYEFVKNSMPPHFFPHYNDYSQTASDVFSETHRGLVESGNNWISDTSESCSVVAALIAGVAFATASTVPGGTKEDSGTPILEKYDAFDIFAISSLVALCFSVTALLMFLAILTSRYQKNDFRRSLPRKILVALTSLIISVVSMLVSFCAGHFFILKDKLKNTALPVYVVMCLPVLYAIAQFPMYINTIRAMFTRVPKRSYKVMSR